MSRRRLVAIPVAALAIAVGPATPAGSAKRTDAPPASVTVGSVRQAPDEVRDYWTAARMRAAKPPPLWLESRPPVERASRRPRAAEDRPTVVRPSRRDAATDVSAASASFPERVHGKVFFKISGGSSPGDFVCSGTVVSSPGHTLVWTAGHCVNDAEFGGGFATSWAFVPGYRNGERPFGTWPARRLFTTRGWREDVNIRVDLGGAALARDREGRGIEDAVGARGIAFGQPRQQTYTALGYPAIPTLFRPEFDGQRLYACTSPRTGDDDPPGGGPAPMEIDCDMSAGASGGGWVSEGGDVNSVTSYAYAGDFNHLYGPYQGSIAARLYEEAGGTERLCAGRAATNLGGTGRDNFAGSAGNDAFRLAGGRDRARADRGRDRLCGGAGRDLLIGGPGRDRCDGGPGEDRARGCEVTRRVP